MFDEHRPDEIELTLELAAMEARLRRLTPVTPRVDRDRLMFEAGRAIERCANEPSPAPSLLGRGNSWFWPAATAMMTAATLLLATMLVWQNHSTQPIATNSVFASSARTNPPPKNLEPPAADSALPQTLTWNSAPPITSGYLAMRATSRSRVAWARFHQTFLNPRLETTHRSVASQQSLPPPATCSTNCCRQLPDRINSVHRYASRDIMNRHSAIFCIALAIGLGSPTLAAVTFEKTNDGDNETEVVRMTVTPAAEPVPALRYRLIPRDFDLKPGNRAIYYYRAILELGPTMKDIRATFDEEKGLSHWYGTARKLRRFRNCLWISCAKRMRCSRRYLAGICSQPSN